MRTTARATRPAAFGAVVGGLLGVATAASAAPRGVKGPYLTNLSEDGVDVRVELDGPAPLSVEAVRVDRADAAPRSVLGRDVSPARSPVRVVHLGGLAPSTAYSYTVRAGGAVIAEGRFVSAPPLDSQGEQTFLVYGDNRSNPAAHAAVVRAMMAAPADFLVNTGDLVAQGGNPDDWQSFFDVERPLLGDKALFVGIGNHELFDDRAGANFARYFGFGEGGDAGGPRLYGTARVGRVRLFLLNAMQDFAGGDDRRWLEETLSRSDAEPGLIWRLAVLHIGPWSSGPHGPNTALWAAKIPELLAAHHVDLVFAGHDHIYERGDGGSMKYIVSGGGGAPLYAVTALAPTARKVESAYHFVQVTTTQDALGIVARRVDGSVFDRCSFRKGQPWDCDDAGAPAAASATPSSPATPPRATAHDPPSSASARCACRIPGARGELGGGPWGPVAALGAGWLTAWVRRRSTRRG